MRAAHATKQEQIDAIRERFERATAAVLLDFRGLDVAAANELRGEFRKAGVDYKVVKNTLIKRAVEGTDLASDVFHAHLQGQTAIAWSYEDPSAAAKIVKAFRKDDAKAKKLAVKCGVLDNQVMDGARVETDLASMPGKDEVRAMLLAQLMAPAQKLVMQLGAPAQNLAFAFDARRRQLEEQG